MIDQRRNDVSAGLQIRSQVHGLVVPMGRVSLGGSQRNQLSVDIQLVPVVSGDMDDIIRRNGCQIDILAEIIDSVVLRTGAGYRNPPGRPVVGRQVERSGRVTLRSELRKSTHARQERECQKGK